MLVADYGKEGAADWRRVVYDPDAGTVTFYNCYQSRRFLAWGADTEFTCRVSEIRAVYWSYQHNIESILLIITPAGQVRIPQKAVGLDGVRSALIGGLAPESRLRWYEYEVAKTVLIIAFTLGAAILGILLIVKTDVFNHQWPVVVIFYVIPLFLNLIINWRGKSIW